MPSETRAPPLAYSGGDGGAGRAVAAVGTRTNEATGKRSKHSNPRAAGGAELCSVERCSRTLKPVQSKETPPAKPKRMVSPSGGVGTRRVPQLR